MINLSTLRTATVLAALIFSPGASAQATPSVDGKRPYGDVTNYPAEMAQALGLPVRKQPDGTLTVIPALDKELEALHEQTMPAMQVFVRHAGLTRNTI